MPGKHFFKMRIMTGFLVMVTCLVVLLSLTNPSTPSIGLAATVAYYKTEAQHFAATTTTLQDALVSIDPKDTQTILYARKALQACRQAYKKIAFFQEYFFKSSSLVYNSPAKYEVEEPYMEFTTPVGLQVIEGLLFEEDVAAKKQELLQEMAVIHSSAQDLQALLFGFTADDPQILESVRLELIRIYTLDITGFDAPLLKSGIAESREAFNSVKTILAPYLQIRTRYTDSVAYYLNSSLQYLNPDIPFDTFDRLAFLTRHALPLQRYLGLMIRDMKLELNTTEGVLNYDAADIFSKDAIHLSAFPGADIKVTPALIKLGKRLFHETALSGNNKISCATCHQPEKHFTDGLRTSIAFDGHAHVKRNAPTLLYSGFQYAQFWDNKAKSIEEQVNIVLHNPVEMNGNMPTAIAQLKKQSSYVALFEQSFPTETHSADSVITADRVSGAIAAYVRALNPRNSAFDQYMTGNTAAMDPSQINGFNLFMGKAQCGTCHFAPLFNGLTPPLYNLTELEVLGTPGNDDLDKPVKDNDNGRYDLFGMEYYLQAFKTPTVRNVSATGPYMHNGAFATLEGVVEFYNKGGGIGLGLAVTHQTLSSRPLNLTTVEVQDIVHFLHALEDKVSDD
jgi:cytochrome c peroxidase